MEKSEQTEILAKVAEALVNDLQDGVSLLRSESASKEISFYKDHRPLLKAGKYRIKATQTLKRKAVSEKTNQYQQALLISGPRFELKQKDIQSVFPPAGATGDFNLNLPQVSFHRATLPWELSAKGDEKMPWLCLVLFTQEEAPKGQSKPIKDFINPDELIADPEKKINVIKVNQQLLPQNHELLVHTRQEGQEGQEGSQEIAFITGNRLPLRNGNYVVHLISLKDSNKGEYISLHQWSFTSLQKKVSFNELMSKNSVGAFRLKPKDKDNDIYKDGYVPLPYFMRKGNTTITLYRSPFIPLGNVPKPESEEEIMDNSSQSWLSVGASRMLDSTYWCSFQLGQLLTLANREIASRIYGWKREAIQKEKSQQTARIQVGFKLSDAGLNLPDPKDQPVKKLPESAKSWLMSLLNLEAVPFNYLFPYEAMLPQLSIRFFKLDVSWLQAILEGALSTAEEIFEFKGIEKLIPESTTGFILRNPVVQHYPEMQVKTYIKNEKSNNRLLFQHKFGDEILLCCYKGKVDAFEFALPGQSLYPGFDKSGSTVSKKIRRPDSGKKGKEVDITDEVLDPDTHCLNLAKLKTLLEAKDSAELAVELMQSMASIKFNVPE